MHLDLPISQSDSAEVKGPLYAKFRFKGDVATAFGMICKRIFKYSYTFDFSAVFEDEFNLFFGGFVVDILQKNSFEVSFPFLV